MTAKFSSGGGSVHDELDELYDSLQDPGGRGTNTLHLPTARAYWHGRPVVDREAPSAATGSVLARELSEGEEVAADGSIRVAVEALGLSGHPMRASIEMAPSKGHVPPAQAEVFGRAEPGPKTAYMPWRVSSDTEARKPDEAVLRAYAKERLDVFRRVVKEHGLFTWWSDHAHEHAGDIGARMRSIFPLFLEPYAEGFPKPEREEDFDVLVDLAYWCGFLHDVGLAGCPSQHQKLASYVAGIASAPGPAEAGSVRKEMENWAYNDDTGFRKPHAVHSAFFLLRDAPRLAGALSPAQIEKVAVAASLHSKSLYTKQGVETLRELAHLEKAKAFIDGVFAREKAGASPPLGVWFSEHQSLAFHANVGGLARTLESPRLTTREWKTTVAMGRCLALADGLRKRGIQFKDNFSKRFRKLPLDATQMGRAPFVHTGSFKLVAGATDHGRATYVEVVGDVLDHLAQAKKDPGLEKLKPDPNKPFLPDTFAGLAPILESADNVFLVPPDSYKWNLGEMGIVATDLVDAEAAGLPIGKTPLLVLRIDTAADPVETAAMMTDVLREGPYTLGKQEYAVLLEHEGPHDFMQWLELAVAEWQKWYKPVSAGGSWATTYKLEANIMDALIVELATVKKAYYRDGSGAAAPLPL